MWPAGVPPLSQAGHTVEQMTALFYLVRRVEAEVGAPFDPEPDEDRCPSCGVYSGWIGRPDSSYCEDRWHAPGEPAPELPPALDDGAFLDVVEVELLKARMLALPDHRIVQLADIAREANDAGRPISVQQKPCVRRWEIARALVLWAEGPHDLDYLALTVSTYAQSLQIRGNDTIGAVISLYTIEQAVALADSFDHVEAA